MADMDSYFPFSAGAGSAASEGSWRKMARMWSDDGVDLTTSPTMASLNALQVYGDSSGKQVKVRTGGCWVNGFYGETTSEKTIAIPDNNTGSTRVDRIVAQVDPGESSNKVTIEQVTGTTSAPALTQSATGVWQVTLAKVTVANGFSTVAAADVTDERAIARGINGSTGGRIQLAESSLSSAAGSVDWQTIPQTFRDLEIRSQVRWDSAASYAVYRLRFNNLSDSTYDSAEHFMLGDATPADAGTSGFNGTSGIVTSYMNTSSQTAGMFTQNTCTISDYTNSSSYRTWRTMNNETATDEVLVSHGGGIYTGTLGLAVNRITLLVSTGNFIAGSKFGLYGVR